MSERKVEICDEEAAYRLLIGVVRQAHLDIVNKSESQGHRMEAAQFLARLQGTSADRVVACRPPPVVDRQTKNPPRKRRKQQEEDW